MSFGMVAPRAGARIETRRAGSGHILRRSLPVRGRGLKRVAGALERQQIMSLPVRGRGLKLNQSTGYDKLAESPPVRGRRLKRQESPHPARLLRAPRSARPARRPGERAVRCRRASLGPDGAAVRCGAPARGGSPGAGARTDQIKIIIGQKIVALQRRDVGGNPE